MRFSRAATRLEVSAVKMLDLRHAMVLLTRINRVRKAGARADVYRLPDGREGHPIRLATQQTVNADRLVLVRKLPFVLELLGNPFLEIHFRNFPDARPRQIIDDFQSFRPLEHGDATITEIRL